MEVIDTAKSIKQAKKRFILNLIFIISFIVIYVAASVLLLILSPNNYTVYMIINIVISTLCLGLIIFYFGNIFPVVKHYYSFYKSLATHTNTKKRIVTYEKEDEIKYRDGVKYRQFVFSYEEAGKKFFDRVLVLDNDSLVLDAGVAYKIYTYQNVMLTYEVYQYANAQ